MTDGVWVVRPAECEGVQEILANPKEGKVILLVWGWDEWGITGGSAMLITAYHKVS